MNKSQLIDTIAERLELGRRQAVETVEAVFETIQQAVVNGERVVISGFGVFEKVQRAARLGRNPATGEPVPVQETVVPKFRPGTEFKAYVSGAKDMAQTAVQSARGSVHTARERVERTVQAAADQINWPSGGEDAEHPDGEGGATTDTADTADTADTTGTAAAKPAPKPASAPRATTRAPGKTTRSTATKTGTTRSTTRGAGTTTRRAAAGEKTPTRRTSATGGTGRSGARATGGRGSSTRSTGAAKKDDSGNSDNARPDGAPGASQDGSSSSG